MDSLRGQPTPKAQPSLTKINHLVTAFHQVKQIVSAAQSSMTSYVPVQPSPPPPPVETFVNPVYSQEFVTPTPQVTPSAVQAETTTLAPDVTTEVVEVVTEIPPSTTPTVTTPATTVTTMVISRGVDSLLPIVELPHITYDVNPNPGPHVHIPPGQPNSFQTDRHKAELISTINMLTNEINALSQPRPPPLGMHYVAQPGTFYSLPPLPPTPPTLVDGRWLHSYIPIPTIPLTGGGFGAGSVEHIISQSHAGNGAANLPPGAGPKNHFLNSNNFILRSQFPVTLPVFNEARVFNNFNPNFEAPPSITDAPPPPDPRDAQLMEQHLAYVSNFTIPDYAAGQASSIKQNPPKSPTVPLSSLLAKLASKLAISAPQKSYGPSAAFGNAPSLPPTTAGQAPPPGPPSKWDGILDISPQQHQQVGSGQWQQFPAPLSSPQPFPPPNPAQPNHQYYQQPNHQPPNPAHNGPSPPQSQGGAPSPLDQPPPQWNSNRNTWPQPQPPHQGLDRPNIPPPQPLQPENAVLSSANRQQKPAHWDTQKGAAPPGVNHRGKTIMYPLIS